MSRSLRRATTVEGRLAETAARLDRRARESVRHRDAPTPALDEARAVFGAVRPSLVVESLDEKLERRLPGAFVEATPSAPPPDERWRVRQRGRFALRTLAVGPTPREAIARAVFLFGGGR